MMANAKPKQVLFLVAAVILLVIIFNQKVVIRQKKENAPTPTLPPSQGLHLEEQISPPTVPPTQKSLSFLNYPHSQKVGEDKNSLFLESFNDPKVITEWYKEKIKSMGMQVNSFVQTSTNGNILNSLTASDAKNKVRVEITKENSQPIVKISVYYH